MQVRWNFDLHRTLWLLVFHNRLEINKLLATWGFSKSAVKLETQKVSWLLEPLIHRATEAPVYLKETEVLSLQRPLSIRIGNSGFSTTSIGWEGGSRDLKNFRFEFFVLYMGLGCKRFLKQGSPNPIT